MLINSLLECFADLQMQRNVQMIVNDCTVQWKLGAFKERAVKGQFWNRQPISTLIVWTNLFSWNKSFEFWFCKALIQYVVYTSNHDIRFFNK